MTRARENGARRRAEDRARRRATEEQRSGSDPIEAARAAAAAAAAGATAGALRAIAGRRGETEENGDGAVREEAEPRQEVQAEPEPEREPEPEPEPVRPAKGGEPRKLADQARQLLLELRGVEAESVSGLTRSSEGWVVTLEVVEMRRIPESTDVLATYEVEVDERGRLLRYQRCGRYHRSQADRDGRA
jgi:hypothetical protein